MAKPNPRQTQMQQVHYLRNRVTFSDATLPIATGEYLGTLPAGSIILGTTTAVSVAFNAGTSNSLTVGGNSPSYNNVATAAQTLAGATGPVTATTMQLPTGLALGSITADTDIFAAYAQTGTLASAGVADIIIAYIPNNDK